MKKFIVIVLGTLGFMPSPSSAQTEAGSWELSVAANLGSISQSSEVSGGGTGNSSEGESRGYLGLDLRAGWYAAAGFSIEPEIYLLAAEKDLPAFNLGGNLSYTFTIADSPVKPFVIAGYGIGNGIPIMQRLVGRTSNELDIPVVRIGGGAKFFLSRQVAFKVEYRYERYSYEGSFSFFMYSYSYKNVWNYHSVLIGVSVFLPRGE